MATISVLISSAGRMHLLAKCLESLFVQEETGLKIFISVPQLRFNEIDRYLNRYFFKSTASKTHSWALVPIEEGRVHEGRNWAIKNCPEGLLLLLDEDTSLPDSRYLTRLASFHAALSRIELLGGPYFTPPECSFAGRAYNQVARVWMEKYRNPGVVGAYNDLLVAGNISLKLNRKTRAVTFSSSHSFGGEEQKFLKDHWKLGHSSRVIEALGVNHHAQHDLKTFYSRAWLHGTKTEGTLKLSKQDIRSVLKHSGRGPERVMVYSYLLCTRAPRVLKRLQDLQRLIPGR